jgi:4'-phosphopantetheinyl transferase
MDFSSIHELQFGKTRTYVLSYRDFNTHIHIGDLTELEKERFQQISHPVKQREFIAIKLLKSHLFGKVDIHYNDVGAPFILNQNLEISISHTNGMVGLSVADYKVGFDLEPISYKAKRISHKFLSENEKQNMDVDSEIEMTKAWSAKEALYKLAGRKKIIFSSDLLLSRRSENHWIGTIINPDHRIECDLTFSISDDNILTVNPNEARIIK